MECLKIVANPTSNMTPALWDHCHAAIADATLGDNTIGEVLHVSARSLESGHLHAAIVVEMDV